MVGLWFCGFAAVMWGKASPFPERLGETKGLRPQRHLLLIYYVEVIASQLNDEAGVARKEVDYFAERRSLSAHHCGKAA